MATKRQIGLMRHPIRFPGIKRKKTGKYNFLKEISKITKDLSLI
jgi:hypothetical protein